MFLGDDGGEKDSVCFNFSVTLGRQGSKSWKSLKSVKKLKVTLEISLSWFTWPRFFGVFGGSGCEKSKVGFTWTLFFGVFRGPGCKKSKVDLHGPYFSVFLRFRGSTGSIFRPFSVFQWHSAETGSNSNCPPQISNILGPIKSQNGWPIKRQ